MVATGGGRGGFTAARAVVESDGAPVMLRLCVDEEEKEKWEDGCVVVTTESGEEWRRLW